jgi:chemotaxis protein methyltransferase CheR
MFDISDKEFYKLASLIKRNYGINLGKEKKTLLVGRLQNVLANNNFKDFSEYYDYIIFDTTGNAVSTLVDKMTTNHTFFMREAEHFHYFKEKLMPFFTSAISSKDLCIWSAGCSSGEEPYTLAMIIDEFLGIQKDIWNTKILATDLSSKVLDNASKGIYLNEQVAPLPKIWIKNYFKKIDNEKCILIDRIRNEVIFRRLNFMDPVFPFKKKFHIIFCRNVMIYFDTETKKDLIDKFYNLTEPGGYLFIGHSEAIDRGEMKYKCVAPSIYRRE